MTENVEHRTINGKYRIQFEQAASTKGVIGFKCEVNGDDYSEVTRQAENLLKWAQEKAPAQSGNVEVK